MGNCLRSSKLSSQVHDVEQQHDDQFSTSHPRQQKKSSSSGDHNSDDEGTKVKVVLTKEELEWLMHELKVNNRKLEEALAEIQRSRALKSIIIIATAGNHNNCWRPSLESISEDDLDE